MEDLLDWAGSGRRGVMMGNFEWKEVEVRREGAWSISSLIQKWLRVFVFVPFPFLLLLEAGLFDEDGGFGRLLELFA